MLDENTRNLQMDIEKVLSSLDIDNPPGVWLQYWDESKEKASECISLLESFDYISYAIGLLRLPQSIVDAFNTAYTIILAKPELVSLARLWHYIIFHASQDLSADIDSWPLPSADMGSMDRMFPAVVLISGIHHMLQTHNERCIPLQTTIDTLSDVDIWMHDYCSKNGTWGLDHAQWLINHFRSRLFRLGRMQFKPAVYDWKFNIYRNRSTNETLALSHGGIAYRPDGLINGTNGEFDMNGLWISIFEETDDYVRGNRINPRGYAEIDIIEISKHEWDLVLSPGDSILEVHIPAGAKLLHEQCGESMRKAMTFFPTYFPKNHFTGFTCLSWLLDPQFQDIMPENSNIVKFQKEFYLLPALSDDNETLRRVFGEIPPDLTKAPRDTSLRKAILDHTLAGNHMRASAGFIMNKDLKWGHKVYQGK